MPIVTNLICFQGYQPRTLDAEAVRRLRSCGAATRHRKRLTNLILLFEAYLQLTGEACPVEALDDPVVRTRLAIGFVAALHSARFKGHGHWSGAYAQASAFFDLVESAFADLSPRPKLGIRGVPTDELKLLADRFDSAVLDIDRERFWQGWLGRNRNGDPCHFKFAALYEHCGREFTEALFSACCEGLGRGAGRTVPCINELAAFIARDPDIRPSAFQDPVELEDILVKFFTTYMTDAHERGNKIQVALVNWRYFSQFLSTHVLGHIWAEPYGGLPSPKVEAIPGTRTNVRKTADGHEVKHTLLTPVPLSVSDTEAKDLLFGDIEREANYIRQWANHEVDAIWERRERRLALALEGEAAVVGSKGAPNGAGWRISRDNPDRFKHAAATFEARGITPCADSAKRHVSLIYPRPLSELYVELGLPTQCHLMAHAALLILDHPEITPSFLEKLEIYDRKGRLIGLETTDEQTYLVGAKPRKGPELAQQKIILNARTEEIVRQVIALTAPLRTYMKEKKDKRWRSLFLISSTVSAKPTTWRSSLISQYHPWLASRFVASLGLSRDDADDLASRFGLKRLRATAGVLIYLRSGSVQKMAEALGHTHWSPKLLDHYLPRAIQEYFTERWVRIVQEGLIVEAMKGSPRLLEATSFSSLAELDQFLENHAFSPPTAYMASPDSPSSHDSEANHKRVLIGLDQPVLTLLLSIKEAVDSSMATLPGRAHHWAQLAGHVKAHIEEIGRPDLTELLNESARDASAEHIREALHA